MATAPNSGGATYLAYQKWQEASCRTTIMGDSLIGHLADDDRFAFRFCYQLELGGSISALCGNMNTYFGYTTYAANETSNQANFTNGAVAGTYGYWGDVAGAGPTADEYYGIPVISHNWYYDGNLQTQASGTVFRIYWPIAADPWNGGVNTNLMYAPNGVPKVHRFLYYGADGIRNIASDIKIYDASIGAADLKQTVRMQVDARPLWSEGDNPETDSSPRTGGYLAGEANALWPDQIFDSSTGMYIYFQEGFDNSDVIAANGNFNALGHMSFKCAGASDNTWVGGHQIECIGQSSWQFAGFSENNPSASGNEKRFDNDNWLYWRDVTTIDRSIPNVILFWIAPEALSTATAKSYTQNLVDKMTDADAAIGNQTPIVIFVISYKLSGLTTNQMDAFRDGVIQGVATRSNAGYINLYDYYSQATPANVTDGTHPDDATSANAIFANFLSIAQSASGPGMRNRQTRGVRRSINGISR